jgi:signal transduction histidine kinase
VIAASVCGWITAAAALLFALAARRRLAWRMELVARACHELRGPLTAARLGLELGTRMGELAPVRLRALDLELGAAALALDDLAAARCRAGRHVAAFDEVDVPTLLAECAEAWRAAAASQGADVHTRWSGPPVLVRGDRLRLVQAIGNLIANAIEHGGGRLELRGRAEGAGAGAGVRIELIDDGPGLPAPVAELVRRSAGGGDTRGRGLAIASEIAATHGGRVAAGPSERGARLVLELAAEPPAGLVGGRGLAAARGRLRRRRQ